MEPNLPRKHKRMVGVVAVVFTALVALAVGYGVAAAGVLEGDPEQETPPDPTHAWYFVPTVQPPTSQNGSVIVTLNTVNDRADEHARDPEGIAVAFLFLSWDVTSADLGEGSPLAGLNAAIQAKGDTLGWFQARVHSGNETVSFAFPHRVVDLAGELAEVVSIVMVVPGTEEVVAMDFFGHTVRWSTISVDGQPVGKTWAAGASTVKAGEARESETRPRDETAEEV